MSLFEELKRRNVIRVAIGYGVVAWLILQVSDIILNNVEAPAWAFWLILLMLGIGLVLVIVFSWVFEMTPEGLKRESEIDRSQSITQHTGKKLDRLIVSVLVLALAYFAVDKFVLSSAREQALVEAALEGASAKVTDEQAPAPVITPAATEKSIAVLPFVNMSDDASNEYFSDGISEEILNSLAKVKELKVAGRTSSFAFKGQNQDLRAIGEALGVEHILEGSVRKAGDTVRITAQLIKVDDGFHLWSENYDRELTDIFAIQDEIATAILTELKTALLDETSPLISATRTAAEAYELYLLAKQRAYERTEITLQSAADLLDRAIEIDPTYAPAYAQRGIVNLLLSDNNYGTLPEQEAKAKARGWLDKALELDPNQAEAWAGFGLYYNTRPKSHDLGIEALEKALSINPNLNDAANWLVLHYWNSNRGADAADLLQEITERDPLYRPAMGNLVFQLGSMGRTEQARAHINEVEPFMADEAQIMQARGWLDYYDGKIAAGLKRSRAGLEKQPTDRVLKAAANTGNLATHQYEKVFDDNFTDLYLKSLLELGRTEEARLAAEKRASEGDVYPFFYYLNRAGQSDQLIAYLEQRWPSLEAFEAEFPASAFGYREMLDIALAYRRTGNQSRFNEALERLGRATEKTLADGMAEYKMAMLAASYLTLAGKHEQALGHLGHAIDSGYVSSERISSEWPYLADLEGDPEYEAIQARMIEHLNRERALLGLEPISA